MKFDYNNTFRLMKAFDKLSKMEKLLIDYLFPESYVEITYSQFAKEADLNVSNLRNALLHLQELKLVCIVNKYDTEEYAKRNIKYNPMKACFLVDGWMENLLATVQTA